METRELFTQLSSMQYKGRGQVREHIYHMNTIAAKLGKLGKEVTKNMLMKFILKSLPPRFDHFKLTYSIQEHMWSNIFFLNFSEFKIDLFELNSVIYIYIYIYIYISCADMVGDVARRKSVSSRGGVWMHHVAACSLVCIRACVYACACV